MRVMKTISAVLFAVVLPLGACAGFHETPPPDTARINRGGTTFGDYDVFATQQAAFAFAQSSRTRGNPAEAARAAANVDYMAGELSTSPRWDNVGPLTKLQMLQARQTVRQTLGVAPGTRSQAVVDDLFAASDAAAAGNPAAAQAALDPSVFTFGPARTYSLLTDMPFLADVNVATTHAAGQLFPNDNGSGWDR